MTLSRLGRVGKGFTLAKRRSWKKKKDCDCESNKEFIQNLSLWMRAGNNTNPLTRTRLALRQDVTNAIIALPDAGCSSSKYYSALPADMFVFLLRCFCRLCWLQLVSKMQRLRITLRSCGRNPKAKKQNKNQIITRCCFKSKCITLY